MSIHQTLTHLRNRLLGRREPPSPAGTWLAERERAQPEQVLEQHFAAWVAHDLDWILATLAPERARLYTQTRTADKKRITVADARLISAQEVVNSEFSLPVFAHRYRSHLVLKVEYELRLVEPERRRDPTLKDGRDWAYYVLVTEGRGRPWMIADWGR